MPVRRCVGEVAILELPTVLQPEVQLPNDGPLTCVTLGAGASAPPGMGVQVQEAVNHVRERPPEAIQLGVAPRLEV